MNNIKKLQEYLNYKFNDEKLLDTALTHISFAKEVGVESYERLEFLGDAILETIVSEIIYKEFDLSAGKLTKLRASLVSTENLCNIAKNLGLEQMVKKSKSLPNLSKKNTADLFESTLGAIYLDGGMSVAKSVVERLIIIDKENLLCHLNNCEDAKTRLQELMQSLGYKFEYRLISSSGLDHAKIFEVALYINDSLVSKGSSSSIQSAEEICAKAYLDSIN